MAVRKIAIVLFNLGGPDMPAAIRPFLNNLFSDRRIIDAPLPIRKLIAWIISTTRAPKVKPLYAEMGGASPILPNTLAQAKALEDLLNSEGENHYTAYLAMRYWHPFTKQVVAQIKADAPDEIVLLPLYPQFSTTTTESSYVEWQNEARRAGLNTPTHYVGCYFNAPQFIKAEAALIRPLIEQALAEHPNNPPRLLFSAHGLPQKIIDQKGDPYVWQISQTAAAIVKEMALPMLDWRVSYQSRVGPVAWVKPYTDAEIRQVGAEGKPLVIAPIAFVSEHIETLVELDVENKHLAEESGCAGYYRAPTVSTHPDFIAALAAEVMQALSSSPRLRQCPPEYTACPCRVAEA